MRSMGKRLLLLAGSLLLSVGCGPNFDPPSELHSLRVLGVQKDIPYAQPGDTVNLQMLWEDAALNATTADGTKRPITIAWSPPCFDPPGDLYYSCFSDQTVFGNMLPTAGDKTAFDMPADIISRRPPPTDARNAPYGIAYVFFAACAGTLTLLPTTSDTTVPIGCVDPVTNTPLGSDDFVAGYTAVYSFLSFSNHNPVISGFEFNNQPLAADSFCQGEACLALAGSSTPTDIPCDDSAASPDPRCIPSCAADGDKSCHGYPIRPLVDKTDPANQDQDDVSAALLGRHVGEQMWIDYYADGGSFKSSVRLLNDATNGWNDDYGTEYRAPSRSGVARLWAIVHDNRGGVSWAGISLKTQ